ncbi:MAG: tetrathionate reductase family octaheme c-type cytochrome [Desulfovibrio sp.]
MISSMISGNYAHAEDEAPGRTKARLATGAVTSTNTADHSKFVVLQQEFKNGEQVTEACLSCHNEAGLQFHKTIHWTWRDPSDKENLGIGKGGITVNNFCVALPSNEPRCTSCHAGYGWKDKNFDFTSQTKIDCLVCHEQTRTYKKFPTKAGNPVSKPTVFKGNGKTFYPPNWQKVAQSVSTPTRKNCGTCHFYGGGGDGVKHGDLDSSLMKPNKSLDVHMGTDGQNFDCVRCHTTKNHDISGRIYGTPASADRKSLLENDLNSKIMCESCHSATPHKMDSKANDHTDKVACQSCHIPTFARVNPTKMWWDWSKAGQKKNGKPFTVKGPYNKSSYNSKKGEFIWEKDVVPEYYWFNGSITSTTAKDVIDPAKEIKLSWPVGERTDPNSRIMPFKVHRGMTPYDKVNKTMAIPHLFGKDKDAYWKSYNWKNALAAGQKYSGLPFSGEYDFAKTAYVYPTTHMVTPKEDALQCRQCHSKNGRLENLTGFYMPGRDSNSFIDFLGTAIVILSAIGVILHGLMRIFSSRKED